MAYRFIRPALTSALKPHALLRPRLLNSTRLFVQPKTLLPGVVLQSKRPFTFSIPRFSNGDVDPDLVHQLDEELKFENTEEHSEAPAFVKEFLESSSFKINDNVGHDKVVLSRSFGNEKIRVVFSISDINNTVEEYTEEEEIAKEEEHVEKVAEEQEQEEEASFPVRATVIVEKEGKGSLVLNTVAQDGYLHIDAVRHFKEGELEYDDILKHDIGEQRQDLYMGPVFEELDEDLQATFGRYLEERGIDTALATFLPDYIDYKEQKEYVNWLKNINDFVSA